MKVSKWQKVALAAAIFGVFIGIAWAAKVSDDAVAFWLTTLKFLAIAFTGIFGAMGLLTESRDKEGNITVWGRRALTGIIVSVFVSALTQAFDVLKQTNDSAAQLKKQALLLNEINRTINPLQPNDLFVTVKLLIPTDQPLMKSYISRLDGYPPTYPAKSNNLYFYPTDAQAPQKSEPSEYDIWRFISSKDIGLKFYLKQPAPPIADMGRWPDPDLELLADGTLTPEGKLLNAQASLGKAWYPTASFVYDKKTGFLEYRLTNLKSKFYVDKGTMPSLLDFPGAFVVAYLTHTHQGLSKTDDSDPPNLSFELTSVEMKLSTNRRLTLTNFQPRVDAGNRRFILTVPTTSRW